MPKSLAEIEQQARSLLADDRARIAEVLLESLRGTSLSDIEAAWNQEIEQRIAAYERGELQRFRLSRFSPRPDVSRGETSAIYRACARNFSPKSARPTTPIKTFSSGERTVRFPVVTKT